MYRTHLFFCSLIFAFSYSSLMQTNRGPVPPARVLIKLRQVFSHIINGVDIRYREIKDPTIKISLTLREFYIFQRKEDFTHIQSWVESVPGTDMINADNYLVDLVNWTSINGHLSDHVMLFTKYDLYRGDTNANLNGYSYTRFICDDCYKTSIVKTQDYMLTVLTAAHELGHNLGADHDGEGEGLACRANDYFLMSPKEHFFQESKPYSRNPWIFSNCSVESFKRALPGKTCLTNVGEFYDGDELWTFMQALPGEVFSYNDQCEFAFGHGSKLCGSVNNRMCSFMQCTDPAMQTCLKFIRAARGTLCGHNMWCIEGQCVPKARNRQ